MKLLEAQPHLSDQVPALGHIPKLCFQLSLLSNPDVPKSVLMILHQLSLNEVIFVLILILLINLIIYPRHQGCFN